MALALGAAEAHAQATGRAPGTAADAPPAGGGQQSAPGVLPPLRERDLADAQAQHITVGGFAVQGVGDHPKAGITPDAIQKLADAQFAGLGGSAARPAQLGFDQMQGVADAITARYRQAGFIVATAFLPAQTVGADHVVRIQVLEGRIGRIVVKGARRYRPWAISAPAEKLRGKPLRKSEVDSALLYDRDLPGVSVASTFQPGEKTGDTDLVMVAREAKRPFNFSLGANNYGTDLTGRYRAQGGVTWNSPLGIGDQLAANVDYALDPSQNTYGSLLYTLPTVKVPGLEAVFGATRSELQINTGQFAALDVKGPSSMYFAGMDWKFVNEQDLSMTGALHYVHEQSRLSSLGYPLSDERFNVAELGFSMTRTDRRFHGVDMLSVALRKSIDDESKQPDLVSPNHARDFTLARLGYTRIQILAPTQRLYLKVSGQYTRDALAPLEQFAIGGPDSVRAYPIADGLMDRGYYASLEYHVDAPGFANKVSRSQGMRWRELFEVEAFVDFARGFPAGDNRTGNLSAVTYRGAGAGFIFRLPRLHHFELHLDAAKAIGGERASNGHGYHVYARFGFRF
jgi:hemolysin activation/secretion protein